MRSGKQRRAEIKAARLRQNEKHKELLRMTCSPAAALLTALGRPVPVDITQLAPDGSYDVPEFVRRGYYLDMPFRCVDCGQEGVWTAERQRWWYEVAKGGVWTTARRCKVCRAKERERRELIRKVQLERLPSDGIFINQTKETKQI